MYKQDAHRSLDKNLDLKYIFANKKKRKISKDLSFSYNGDIFLIKDKPIYLRYKGVKVIGLWIQYRSRI